MSEPNFVYLAQSGLTGKDGPDSKVRPTFTTDANEYVLADGGRYNLRKPYLRAGRNNLR